MTIGLDARALEGASGRRGVGAYIRGLIGGLAGELRAPHESVLVFQHARDAALELPAGLSRVRLRRPRRAITLWDQLAWPPLLAARGVRVFHSPFYAVPRMRPSGCRIVQTIHDLTPLKLPGSVSRRQARVFRINFRLARSADRIIVPSGATRDDVAGLLGLPSGRIAVIPEAADVTPREIEEADGRRGRLVERMRLKPGYLLHTGGQDMVKNLPGLLQAFARLVGQGRDIGLVIAGEHGRATGSLIARAASLGVLERVSLPGFLPRRDLVALYRGAAALVYPSFAEGFGLPVLEAMACGTPVVAAAAGALPETGGDACLYCDPADTEAMASQAARVLDDPDLAADLSRRGLARAGLFSWSETARRTLDLYREVAA